MRGNSGDIAKSRPRAYSISDLGSHCSRPNGALGAPVLAVCSVGSIYVPPHGFRIYVVEAFPNGVKGKEAVDASAESSLRDRIIEMLDTLHAAGTQFLAPRRRPLNDEPPPPTASVTVGVPVILDGGIVHVVVAAGEMGSRERATRRYASLAQLVVMGVDPVVAMDVNPAVVIDTSPRSGHARETAPEASAAGAFPTWDRSVQDQGLAPRRCVCRGNDGHRARHPRRADANEAR